MISIILLLIELIGTMFRRFRLPSADIIEIRRIPATKSLRAHLFGLSLGFLLASLNLLFDLAFSNLAASALLLIWFMLTTYFSSIFFFFTVLACAVMQWSAFPLGATEFLIMNDLHWYVLGYLFGGALALLYNDLLFLFLHFIEGRRFPLVFAYHPGRNINIIKSPISTEESAFVVLRDSASDAEEMNKQRLYQYHLAAPPPRPYTIVFAANPSVRRRGGNENDTNAYDDDPILSDRDLFLRMVDQALESFEMDPVIGRPEIWSRVRVLTVFNPNLTNGPEYGLVEPFLADEATENNNMIAPRAGMHTNFRNLWRDSRQAGDPDFPADEFDVIFAMTASPTQTRSMADFSDWRAVGMNERLDNLPKIRPGVPFEFDFNPCRKNPHGNKKNTIFPVLDPKNKKQNEFRQVHDYYATVPGRVALNVLSARYKTYTHEFAHAMSSYFHGTIADEYTDCLVFANVGSGFICPQFEHFWANRIDRNGDVMRSSTPVPVPKVFAEYNCTRYPADMNHPTAEESWAGYFPEKFDRHTHCTMDREMGPYRFDELISAFIYDRMMAKASRP